MILRYFYSRFRYFIWVLKIYLFADKIVAHYPELKAKDNRVNLFDYHPELEKLSRYNNLRWNLGDSLGFVITQYMLSQKGLSIDKWVKKRKHFNCVGSNVFSSFQHATVWGSGVLHDPALKWYHFLYRYPFSKLDFRAVRGPLTRDVVVKYGHKCPEIYGDPAILMPYIYQPNYEIKHDLLVIPQYVTEVEFRKNHPDLFVVSMNTDDYKYVIDAIASSKKVITSSLHAVILADAYGVPSILYRGLHKMIDFKYLDYYYSTNRYDIKIADTFEEALEMKPLPIPDLKPLQKGLMKTFPYDLWEY